MYKITGNLKKKNHCKSTIKQVLTPKIISWPLDLLQPLPSIFSVMELWGY